MLLVQIKDSQQLPEKISCLRRCSMTSTQETWTSRSAHEHWSRNTSRVWWWTVRWEGGSNFRLRSMHKPDPLAMHGKCASHSLPQTHLLHFILQVTYSSGRQGAIFPIDAWVLGLQMNDFSVFCHTATVFLKVLFRFLSFVDPVLHLSWIFFFPHPLRLTVFISSAWWKVFTLNRLGR